MRVRRLVFAWISAIATAIGARAELPLARLHSVFPMGGQQGTTVEVTYEGADLDDAERVHFSTGGFAAERKAPGVFSVTIASNVPPGIYETRVVGRFGISNPRFFVIGDRPEFIARGANTSAESALMISAESTVNAFAPAAAADFYKFEAKSKKPLAILCQGEPFDSKMNPALMLYDPSGRELKRDRRAGRIDFTPTEEGTYLLKVHDLQFRGGKQFGYRLTVTERTNVVFPISLARLPQTLPGGAIAEVEPNGDAAQKVAVPCEIEGRFFPQNDVDRYDFTARKGDVFWIEVSSDKLGQPTDPFAVIQRVKEGNKTEDIQELYDSDANLGGAIFNTSTRDPSGRLEVKEEGVYRVQVRDLFNARPDPARAYRLSLRRETPDFNLVALISPPPPFDKEKREAQVWSSFLRRNETLLLKVLALRKDNFNGEIALKVEGLPAGVTASESIVPEGQNIGWISLRADDKAAHWSGPIQVTGKAKINGTELERVASGANIVWDVPDFNNESVRSRLTQEIVLGSSPEPGPFSIEPKQTSVQAAQSTSVAIPIQLTRSGEFKQAVKVRAYVDAQTDPIKEWQVEGAVNETSFELDLKQTKLSPGSHQLYFLAQTSGKIRRVRADEIAALEAAAKQNESEKKSIEEKLKLRDVNGIFASPVVKIFVNAAPTAAK